MCLGIGILGFWVRMSFLAQVAGRDANILFQGVTRPEVQKRSTREVGARTRGPEFSGAQRSLDSKAGNASGVGGETSEIFS